MEVGEASPDRARASARESRFASALCLRPSLLQEAGVELGYAATWSGHCLE